MTLWRDLNRELDAWQATGLQAVFWLRDDDACVPTRALDSFLTSTSRAGVSVALAVIPARCEPALAQLVAAHRCAVLVHGYAHINHAPAPARKCEFGPERDAATMAAEAAWGLDNLRDIFPAALLPVFVPPWNRAAPSLIERLPAAGYRGYSAKRQAQPQAAGLPLAEVHADTDIIDWKARVFRGDDAVLAEVIDLLATWRRAGETHQPLGLLTHHRVHDAAASAFLGRFLSETAAHPGARWATATSAFASGR